MIVHPNKLARGIQATLSRQEEMGTARGVSSFATIHLARYGTLDALITPLPFRIRRYCSCNSCREAGRFRFTLTEAGRRRLAQLRRKRAAAL